MREIGYTHKNSTKLFQVTGFDTFPRAFFMCRLVSLLRLTFRKQRINDQHFREKLVETEKLISIPPLNKFLSAFILTFGIITGFPLTFPYHNFI